MDCKNKDSEEINKKIVVSRLYYTLQSKENGEEIKLNYDVEELCSIEDIDDTMADYAEKVNALFDDYTVFVESKLRSLIH